METYHEILSPLGEQSPPRRINVDAGKTARPKPLIGLLDNSKPNVAIFLQALETRLGERSGSYEFIRATKPRSAMPCPGLDALAAQCDYVINAVAD
jgi:hypothetical protein